MFRYLSVLFAVELMLSIVGGAIAQVATPVPGGQTSVIGTAAPLLPEGDPDAVSVIAFAPNTQRDEMIVIVKNNTDQPASSIEVVAEFRDTNGQILGVSERSNTRTGTLYPGEITIMTAADASVDDPTAGISFSVSYVDGLPSRTSIVDLVFVSAEQTNDRVVGEIMNPSTDTLDDIYLYYACFGSDGEILGLSSTSLDGRATPLESRPFQVMNDTGADCEYFLVSGFGFT